MKPTILNVDLQTDHMCRTFFISTPFDDTLDGKVLHPPEVSFFDGFSYLEATMPLTEGIMLVKQILSV